MNERPDPNRGLTGGGDGRFFVRYQDSNKIDRYITHVHNLNATSLTPRFIRRIPSAYYPHSDLLIYERVYGHNLSELPSDMREQTYTNAFAKKLAQVLTDLHNAGFTHGDAHAGNFMLEDETGKIVIVDDETIGPVDPELKLPRQLADILLGTYLQENPFLLVMELNRIKKYIHERQIFMFIHLIQH